MEEDKISVTLLSYTPNPEKVIATAMRQSRYSESVGKLDLNETEIKHLLNLAITLGHFSVFEHAFSPLQFLVFQGAVLINLCDIGFSPLPSKARDMLN